MRLILALALGALLLSACARPIDRPLSGAPPLNEGSESALIGRLEPPPTLAPPTREPTRTPTRLTPTVGPTPTPTATPPLGGRPILRGLQPAPNATLPAGEITISAQIVSFSTLSRVTVTLNGQPVQSEVGGRDERNWTAFLTPKLGPGEYEVRMVAVDQDGREGGFRWQFKVAAGEAQPIPTTAPTLAATPTQAPSKPGATPTPVPEKSPSPVPTGAVQPSATPRAESTSEPTPPLRATSTPAPTPEPAQPTRAPLLPTNPPQG